MQIKKIGALLVVGVTLGLSSTGCEKKPATVIEERDTAGPPPQPLQVHTYLTISLDSTVPPRDTTHIFGTADTVHGIIQTENAHDGTVLLGRWYYMKDGQKIAENSTRLSLGTNLSHFDLINEQRWIVGDYKLIVLIDGAPKDSVVFSIASKK